MTIRSTVFKEHSILILFRYYTEKKTYIDENYTLIQVRINHTTVFQIDTLTLNQSPDMRQNVDFGYIKLGYIKQINTSKLWRFLMKQNQSYLKELTGLVLSF